MTEAIEAALLVPYALYRWFDTRERLLYIGKTSELGQRTSGHIARSIWMQFAASSTIERHGNSEDLSSAEREAIEAEHPLFNRQYNDTPEARERLRAYLEEVGRLDLLTPKMRAALAADQRARERAERAAKSAEHSIIEDEERWPAWIPERDRWEAAAEHAWWRPWFDDGSNWQAPEDLLSLSCRVLSISTALACWSSERRSQDREGYGRPLVWASHLPSWDEPPVYEKSVLLDRRARWSAHADITCATPWEYFTAEIADVQKAFAEALLAAGRCLSVQTGERAVLWGFDSETEACIAGAVLSELAWGHTRVAKECTTLLRQFGTVQPVDGWNGGDGFPIPI